MPSIIWVSMGVGATALTSYPASSSASVFARLRPPVLRSHIVGVPDRHAREVRRQGGANDLAAVVPFDEVLADVFRTQSDVLEVHVDRLIPGLLVQLRRLRDGLDTGVVGEDINPSELVDGLVEGGFNLVLAEDIGLDRECLLSFLLDPVRGFGQVPSVLACDRDDRLSQYHDT